MLRRFTRTPDSSRSKGSGLNKRNKKDKSSASASSGRGVDPPPSNPSFSSTSGTNSFASHDDDSNEASNMRSLYPRSNQSRSTDLRSAASASTNATSSVEDKMLLRSILRGAMAAPPVAPPDDKEKKAMMRRVLARTKNINGPTPTSVSGLSVSQSHPPSTTSVSTLQTKSTFSTEREKVQQRLQVITENITTRVTETQSTPARNTSKTPEQNDSISRLPTRILERVDANPTALAFRDRLRKATQPRGELSPPRLTVNPSNQALEGKTREMIQERMRQRLAPSRTAIHRAEENVTEEDKEDENDPDLEGYDAFFQTLQSEVHGQHSLLWASFSAIMRNEHPPELEPVPPAKGFRFDKRTKEMLTMMNAFLQEKPQVVHVATTQLVNDKKFSKELRKTHQVGGVEAPPPPPQPQKNYLKHLKQVDVTTKAEPIDLVPTVSSSTSSEMRDRYKVTAGDSGSLPSSTAAMAQSMDFDSESNPGVEITLGQFELKVDEKTHPQTPSDATGAELWTRVQLRSVKHSQTDSSKSSTPNFAKVQLRKVPPPLDVKQPASTIVGDKEVATTLLGTHESHTPCPAPEEESKQKENIVKEPVKSLPLPKPPLSSRPDEKINSLENQQHLVDSKEKVSSSDSTPKKIDEAVYVNLKPGPDDSEGDQNKVIIGRKNIMVVKAKSDDKQAVVLWKLPRTDAASLTIDMTQCMVKVISLDGKLIRELKFDTSGDCLKFANAFYEKFSKESVKEPPAKPKAEIPKEVVEAADDDGDTEFAAVRLERLNDEEQAVLDTYRRLRRSKPPKDALTESIASEKQTPSLSSSLLPVEEQIAKKYRKMLKMGLPLAAVQHAMAKDAISQKIIDNLVREAGVVPESVAAADLPSSPLSTFSSSVALSEEDNGIVEKYKKMIKLKIPEEAIRHKMRKDGVDERLYEFVFEKCKDDHSDKKPPGKAPLSPADEAVAERFRKLLSRGVPKEAVRHGMAKENVAAHIVIAVMGETEQPDASIVSVLTSKQEDKDNLTPEEEKIVAQFKKLVKRQIPRQQILDRMKQEAVSEKVMVAVLGKKGISVYTQDDGSQSKGTSSRFVQIHWTPLSGSQLDNSVWKSTKTRGVEVAAPEGFAFSKLKELFEKKTNNNLPKDRSTVTSEATPAKAKLLDINRSNNVAISLKAFKDYTYSELADIIKFLDPLHKLHGERVHFLRDLLPTVSETKLVMAYDGPESRLEPAEIWFKSIVGIKRIGAKVHVLRTMEMLEIESRSIGENLRLLTKVCNQVMDSERLQDLLVMVLQVGNIMNEGTRTGGAAGFKLDSLLKLTQTKSGDGKTTVLDYLVEDVFIAKGDRHKLDLNSDFPDCSIAGRMLIGDLVAEVKAMQDSLTQCKDELEALRKEALGKNNDVLSAIAKIESQEKNSIYGAIERLEKFVVFAEDLVNRLVKEKDEALSVSRELCMYCGEGGGTAAATSLLSILSEFASSIEAAVRKSDEKRKARERRQKRNTDEWNTGKGTGETHGIVDGNGEEKQSLVILVNKMLKDANPRVVEDFRKGRILDNPSQLMQAIYEKEQTRGSSDKQRASLATAIQEKCGDIDEEEFLTARTKFGSPRTNLRKKANDKKQDCAISSSQQRPPPPLPWSPLAQRDTDEAKCEDSEAASMVTDTSTMVTSFAGEIEENKGHAIIRPTQRPTPEAMSRPLRSQQNTPNVQSDQNDSAMKRTPNIRPTPEAMRLSKIEKQTHVPEMTSRVVGENGRSDQATHPQKGGAAVLSNFSPALNGSEPALPNEKIFMAEKSEESSSIEKLPSLEASPTRQELKEGGNIQSIQANSCPGPQTAGEEANNKAGMEGPTSSFPLTEVTQSENIAWKVEPKAFGSPNRVSMLAAAFSKSNCMPIQPPQSSYALTARNYIPSENAPAAEAKNCEPTGVQLSGTAIAQPEPEFPLSASIAEASPIAIHIEPPQLESLASAASFDPKPDPPTKTNDAPVEPLYDFRPDPPTQSGESVKNQNADNLGENSGEIMNKADAHLPGSDVKTQEVQKGADEQMQLLVTDNYSSMDSDEQQQYASLHDNSSTETTAEAETSSNPFDISAAQNRLAYARKSVDGHASALGDPNENILMPGTQSTVDSVLLEEASETLRGRGITKKPSMSLQELAKLKREKRSIERSPMKEQVNAEEKASPAQDLPSLTGYLQIARQKRTSHSGNSTGSLPRKRISSMESTPNQQWKGNDQTTAHSNESSFFRMAREKRAARKKN